MTLINHLKTAGDATPYFVSYYSGEGSDQAQNVHHALQTAGTPGFLSMTMTAGTTSRATMISALRNARTVLLIESPHYHSRPVCQVERDYSVARGARIIRVGTCPHSALVDCPPWIDDNLQYVNMQSARGFELQQLLSTPLPSPVELETRRRAAISLIEKTSAGDATLLATKLGIIDQLSGSGRVQKAELCQAMFLNPTQANRFCAEFDLDPLF